jgi:hypothetical protein
MIQENGARKVKGTLTPVQMTFFPPGSMHTIVNNGESRPIRSSILQRGVLPEPAQAKKSHKSIPKGFTDSQLVSALSRDDAGTLDVTNAM